MPTGAHHVSCVSADSESILAFLRGVVGLDVVDRMNLPADVTAPFLGWPEGHPGEATMLGTGSKGLIEIVALPEPLAGQIRPGLALITFAVPDLEERVAAALDAGYQVSDIHTFKVNDAIEVAMAVVTVGGVSFELIRYNTL
jgi:catechol 2,3-dioxygenase-like lactoylglutathione lyase family enzyme